MSDDYVKKLYRHPSSRTSAETVLHQTIEKLPKIKAIGLFILWDDESYDTDWSTMSVKELCTGTRILTLEADRALYGEYPAPPKRDNDEGDNG